MRSETELFYIILRCLQDHEAHIGEYILTSKTLDIGEMRYQKCFADLKRRDYINDYTAVNGKDFMTVNTTRTRVRPEGKAFIAENREEYERKYQAYLIER